MNPTVDLQQQMESLVQELVQLKRVVEENKKTIAKIKGGQRQLVTLLQLAEACNRSKQSFKMYSREKEFPRPVNPDRRNGQTAFYDWNEVRTFLLNRIGMDYPADFCELFLG